MGDKINLVLDQRTQQGKKVAGLRKEGLVPGVIYGQGFDPIMVQSEYNVLEKVVREAGKHTPVYATIAGKKKITMIKDIDRDPVKSRIRHVSFHAVKANEAVTAEVPIVLIGEGESPAEKAGLMVLQALENVEVKALPANLPASLEVSMATLESPGDDLTLADVTLPENVEFADPEQDLSLVIANVYEPSALQAANEAAGGEAESVDEVEAENGGGEPESDAPATGASDKE
jgi:large subunit ribosomal protein L25